MRLGLASISTGANESRNLSKYCESKCGCDSVRFSGCWVDIFKQWAKSAFRPYLYWLVNTLKRECYCYIYNTGCRSAGEPECKIVGGWWCHWNVVKHEWTCFMLAGDDVIGMLMNMIEHVSLEWFWRANSRVTSWVLIQKSPISRLDFLISHSLSSKVSEAVSIVIPDRPYSRCSSERSPAVSLLVFRFLGFFVHCFSLNMWTVSCCPLTRCLQYVHLIWCACVCKNYKQSECQINVCV